MRLSCMVLFFLLIISIKTKAQNAGFLGRHHYATLYSGISPFQFASANPHYHPSYGLKYLYIVARQMSIGATYNNFKISKKIPSSPLNRTFLEMHQFNFALDATLGNGAMAPLGVYIGYTMGMVWGQQYNLIKEGFVNGEYREDLRLKENKTFNLYFNLNYNLGVRHIIGDRLLINYEYVVGFGIRVLENESMDRSLSLSAFVHNLYTFNIGIGLMLF